MTDVRTDDPDAVLTLAEAALREREEPRAIPVVAEAARRHPGDVRLSRALGALHRALDDLGPAIVALEQAVAQAPDDAESAHLLARCALDAGRPAVARYDRARALAPDDPRVRLGRVTALLAEGGPAAAIVALEEELVRTPRWGEGQAQLARLRWSAGDVEGFARGFEAALAAAPRDLDLWSHYLATLLFAGRPAWLLGAVARGRAAAGRAQLFDVYEAVAHDDAGDLARAAPLFAALASSDDPGIRLYRLRHKLRAGRYDEAAGLAEEGAASPHVDAFLPYLALAWRLTGDPRWPWLEGDERLVGIYDLADELGPLDDLADRLRALHRTVAAPLGQSVRGGTQADGVLTRQEPELRRARAAIIRAVERHIAQLPPPDPAHPILSQPRDRPVRLSGSWSVRLTGGGHHAGHVHPRNWFSSALYVSVPDDAGHGRDQAGWLSLGAPPADLGLDLPPLRRIEPKPGRLVLFPSTMWHATIPFDAGERLTMAFDVAHPPAPNDAD